jgi:putative transposase
VTLTRAAVLRPGDWVAFDGGEYQVLALAGTSVRLRSTKGRETVVLAAYLMAAPQFVVIDAAPLPPVEPIGLFDALSVTVRDEACAWERHVVEVETGLPPGAAVGTIPRRGFDPASTTLVQRDQTKATELGVSVRTVQNRRARYAQQGLWGLVDQRAARVSAATGRTDPRLVAAIREVIDAETDTSTGTRSRLIRRVVKAVETRHGPGVVPLPGKTTFYK